MHIKGKVISGDNIGSYFISLNVYRKQFIEKLDFEPYPGTLNIEIAYEDAKKILDLDKKMGIIKGQGKYGDVKYIKAKINGISGALVFPVKTHHPPHILEFIAPENLRISLDLTDGTLIYLDID